MTSTTCFVACQDEEDALMTTNKTLTDPTTENRFLTFSTFSDLQNLIDTLQSMDSADLVHWNKDNNFISLYIINEAIMHDEEVYYTENVIPNYKENELTHEMHSNLFNDYSHLLKRKTIDEDSSYYYYDVDISNYDLTYVVNKDGIVKVGDSIFQFKDLTYSDVSVENIATVITGKPISRPYLTKSRNEYLISFFFNMFIHIIPANAPNGVTKAPMLLPMMDEYIASFNGLPLNPVMILE